MRTSDTYVLLGETEQARLDAMRDLVRAGLDNLFEDMGVKDVRYIFGIHRNTDNPHAHVVIARSALSSITGDATGIENIPEAWFATDGLTPSRIAGHFTKALNNLSLAVPPPSVQTRVGRLGVRETMIQGAGADDPAGQSAFNKAVNYLLSEREISPRAVDSLLANGSLYASQQGRAVFVHRDPDGQATGSTIGNVSTGDAGHFYIGDLRTATRFILVSSPIEALSLSDLTAARDLSEVCFVSIAGNNPQDSLLQHIAARSKFEPVRVVWALGLDAQGMQDKEHFDDTEERLTRFHAELGGKTLEMVSYAPKKSFGRTWNSQLQQKHMSGEIATIQREANDRNLVAPVVEAAAPVPTAAIDAATAAAWVNAIDGNAIETNDGLADGTNVVNVQTVRSESNEPGGELSYEYDEPEALQDEAEATEAAHEELPETTSERVKESPAREATVPARVAMREKTNAVRDTPLPDVMRALGLDFTYVKGEWMYVDGGGRFRIKVKDDLFCNRIDSDRGGKGALDLVMYVHNTDFTNARNWLVETFYNQRPQDIAAKPQTAAVMSLPVTSEAKQPLRMPPANDQRLDVVRSYLTTMRGISPDIVENAIRNGSLYANSMSSAVFVHRNAQGAVTGATWRATDSHLRGNAPGTDKSEGWYYLSDLRCAKVFVLVEAPIEALSYLDLHRTEDLSETAIISLAGSSVPKELLALIGKRGAEAKIIFALNNDKAGEKGWVKVQEMIGEADFQGSIERKISRAEDWNDELLAIRHDARIVDGAEEVQSEVERSIAAGAGAAAQETEELAPPVEMNEETRQNSIAAAQAVNEIEPEVALGVQDAEPVSVQTSDAPESITSVAFDERYDTYRVRFRDNRYLWDGKAASPEAAASAASSYREALVARAEQVNEHGVYIHGKEEIVIPTPSQSKVKLTIEVVQDVIDGSWRAARSITIGTSGESGPIIFNAPAFGTRAEAISDQARLMRERLERKLEGGHDNYSRQNQTIINKAIEHLTRLEAESRATLPVGTSTTPQEPQQQRESTAQSEDVETGNPAVAGDPADVVAPVAPEGWILEREESGERFFLRSERYEGYRVGLHTDAGKNWGGVLLTSRTRAGVVTWQPAKRSFGGVLEVEFFFVHSVAGARRSFQPLPVKYLDRAATGTD